MEKECRGAGMAQILTHGEYISEKYEREFLSFAQVSILPLKKEVFPSPADAAALLADAARGQGRIVFTEDPIGGGPFPKAVFFQYGSTAVGAGVLLDVEAELDQNLEPVKYTCAFDPDTIVLYLNAPALRDLKRFLRGTERCGSPFACLEFGWDMRVFLSDAADRGLDDRLPFYLSAWLKRWCCFDSDECIAFMREIRAMAGQLGFPGLGDAAGLHWRVRLSGAIKAGSYGLTEDELARFHETDLHPSAKAEAYRGGKCLILGEFDAGRQEIVLYVCAVCFLCSMDAAASRLPGEDDDEGAELLASCFRARLFSVLAHELFHAFHYSACKDRARHWALLAPESGETLHQKCKRMERLCVAESLATVFEYVCCLYQSARHIGREECMFGKDHYLHTACRLYESIRRRPVPGWPYAGMRLLLRQWREDAAQRHFSALVFKDRGAARVYAQRGGSFDFRAYLSLRGLPYIRVLFQFLRRLKGPDAERVFALSLEDWDAAYRHLTKTLR